MMNIDYIIVGAGYAGLFVAHQLIKNNKTFVIFSDGLKSASEVSAGMVNPVVLKKFTTFWKAQEQIDFLKLTMQEMQDYLEQNFLVDSSIHRIFHNENERNLWLKKSESEDLKTFLSREFKKLEGVINPYATGEVIQSTRLNVSAFFSSMKHYLDDNNHLRIERFDYDLLNVNTQIYAQKYHFKHIVFAEGIAVRNNPFFHNLEINPNKGHHLKVELSEAFKPTETIKKKHFLFNLQENIFYYGGTYDRDSLEDTIDIQAIEQLEQGLKEFYKSDYKIVEKNFGFRPTVRDRRPILGRHKKHCFMYVFNGLGARGILNANYFAKILYDFIENKVPIPEEVSIERFTDDGFNKENKSFRNNF